MPALVGEVGYSTLERRATRPTLDVNGLWGGFQGEGTKTIIPAHAHAKVSCRLVADQEPSGHLRAPPRPSSRRSLRRA
ncbi:MAG: peptidase dimerization domain-containing protein [Candidatus Limnocylindrales bacterium]